MPDSSLRIYDERVAQPSRPTRVAPTPVAASQLTRAAATPVAASQPSREQPVPAASRPSGERPSTLTGPIDIPVLKVVSPPATDELDVRILAILGAPARMGETIDAAFGRKERELGELFAQLSVMGSRALHRRLSTASSNDHLATQFGRLVAVRRSRLLGFLADVRRREAVAMVRKR